jgi:hypothetical protein
VQDRAAELKEHEADQQRQDGAEDEDLDVPGRFLRCLSQEGSP